MGTAPPFFLFFFSQLYALWYTPRKLTPENGPSHKVNNLPTINFQVLCLFQGGYHSLFFVGGSVVPRRPILETRRFLASNLARLSADQLSIDGICLMDHKLKVVRPIFYGNSTTFFSVFFLTIVCSMVYTPKINT